MSAALSLNRHGVVAYTEISSEAQPTQIGGEQPPTDRIDLSPGVGQIAYYPAESEDVSCCSLGAAHAKVKRGPDEVQGELDGVECCSLLVGVRLDDEGYSSVTGTFARATVSGFKEDVPVVQAR